MVVSHQPRPWHVDPLGAYGVSRLWVVKGNRNSAGLGSPRSTEKDGLVGFEQGETTGIEVDDSQPTLQRALTQLKGAQVGGDGLKELLQIGAALE